MSLDKNIIKTIPKKRINKCTGLAFETNISSGLAFETNISSGLAFETNISYAGGENCI
jgi:hypothetical protein